MNAQTGFAGLSVVAQVALTAPFPEVVKSIAVDVSEPDVPRGTGAVYLPWVRGRP